MNKDSSDHKARDCKLCGRLRHPSQRRMRRALAAALPRQVEQARIGRASGGGR